MVTMNKTKTLNETVEKNEIIHWALIFIEHQCLRFVLWYLGKQPDKPYFMYFGI